jgi:hypothetical protein
MIQRLAFAIFWSLTEGVRIAHKTEYAVDPEECTEQAEPPSLAGVEEHPIGPIYKGAKTQLDRLVREMSKLGKTDGPSFDTSRSSVYDAALSR